MTPVLKMLAGYNLWANSRLYAAAEKLPPSDYEADCGVFFRSLNGTLNHLLVADRVWMRRFTGDGDLPDRLDAILFEKLGPLRAARQVEDERILAYVEGLDEAALAETISYRPITSPGPVTQPLWPALLHMFNHQTHHRGQAHACLTRLVGEAPVLDLMHFQRGT